VRFGRVLVGKLVIKNAPQTEVDTLKMKSVTQSFNSPVDTNCFMKKNKALSTLSQKSATVAENGD